MGVKLWADTIVSPVSERLSIIVRSSRWEVLVSFGCCEDTCRGLEVFGLWPWSLEVLDELLDTASGLRIEAVGEVGEKAARQADVRISGSSSENM